MICEGMMKPVSDRYSLIEFSSLTFLQCFDTAGWMIEMCLAHETCAAHPERFCVGTNGKEKAEKHWLTQMH